MKEIWQITESKEFLLKFEEDDHWYVSFSEEHDDYIDYYFYNTDGIGQTSDRIAMDYGSKLVKLIPTEFMKW